MLIIITSTKVANWDLLSKLTRKIKHGTRPFKFIVKFSRSYLIRILLWKNLLNKRFYSIKLVNKNKTSCIELRLQTDLRVFCVTEPFFFCPKLRIVSIFDNWSVFEILKALGLVQIFDFLHFLPWKSKTEALKRHDILFMLFKMVDMIYRIQNNSKNVIHCRF